MSTPKTAALSLLIAVVALTNSSAAQTLVHLWAFDEPTGFTQTFADSSGNSHTGTGAGDIVSGRFGNAVNFLPASNGQTGGIGDGVDWVDPTPGDTALPTLATDSWTISMWTNFDTPPEALEYVGGFGVDDKESDGNQHRARAVTAFPNFHFWGASIDLDAGFVFPADSQWHMSTITYDGNSTELSMFFDGVRVANTTFGGSGPFADAPAEVHAGNPSNWNEEFEGSVDELSVWSGVLAPGQIGGLFLNNDIQQIVELQATVVVDRGTGHVTLRNFTSDDIDNFVGYEVTSSAGSLDPDSWVTITGNLDEGQGSMPIDSGPWSVTSTSDVLVSEADQGPPPGTFHLGQAIDLGSLWTKSTYEDISVSLFTDDGVTQQTLDLIVTYTGDPVSRSDLDGSGEIDLTDWQIFSSNGFTSLSGQSLVEAALHGDLDNDGDNDRQDFRLFRADYIAANGEAAFQALTAAVPEPSTAVGMMIVGAAAFLLRRRE